MYNYDRPSWTGEQYEIECYFPTWVIPKDHKVTQALEKFTTTYMVNLESDLLDENTQN